MSSVGDIVKHNLTADQSRDINDDTPYDGQRGQYVHPLTNEGDEAVILVTHVFEDDKVNGILFVSGHPGRVILGWEPETAPAASDPAPSDPPASGE